MIILRNKLFSEDENKSNSGAILAGLGGATLGAGIGAWRGGDSELKSLAKQQYKSDMKSAIEGGMEKSAAKDAYKTNMKEFKTDLKKTSFGDKWKADGIIGQTKAGKDITVGQAFKRGTFKGAAGGAIAGLGLALGANALMNSGKYKE